MSQTNTQWDKTGISIIIEPKERTKKLSAGAYRLVDLTTINQSYLSLAIENIEAQGRKGIRVTNDGSLPVISERPAVSVLYTGYQGTEPAVLNWIEVPVSVDQSGGFSLLVDNALPLSFYRFKIRIYDGQHSRDLSEATFTTPTDMFYTGINAAMDAIALIIADGWVSVSEKPREITRYNVAESDKNILINQAKTLGVGYTAFQNAWIGLSGYIAGLGTFMDSAVDTAIDATAFWGAWFTFDAEKTKLMASLQASTRSIDAIAIANVAIPTPASALIDGVTQTDGKQLLLAAQTVLSQNGIYTLSTTTSGGTGTFYPSTNPTGTYTCLGTSSQTSSQTFSGWSGVALSGTLRCNLTTTCVDDTPAVSSIRVYYSTDAGTNWTLWDTFGPANNGDHSISASIASVAQSQIRVRVDYTSSKKSVKSYDTDLGGYTFDVFSADVTVNITGVSYDAVSTSTTMLLTKVRDVNDGEVYYVNGGTTYGTKNVTVYKASDGSITLNASSPNFESKLTNPPVDGYVLSSTAAGVKTWVAPTTFGTGNQFFAVSGPATSTKTYTFPNQNSIIPGKYSASFGDGTTTSFTITHNLGTTDVNASFHVVATGQTVLLDYVKATMNTITFVLPVAPTTNQYRVVVVG